MHRFIYIMFFLTLAVDTFFSQTLTQMIVLGKIFNIITNSINAVDNLLECN